MIHPSGIRTTDYEPSEVFEPNSMQIASAARRASDDPAPQPRRRLSPTFAILFVLAVSLITYAIMRSLG
jgi:hypothetical protein